MPNEKKIDSIRESKRPFKLLDIFVFAAIISLAVIVLVFSFSKDANYVEISYQNQTKRYSLSVDREITVKEGYVVAIKDGICYVLESDCHDKTCVKTGAIKRVNQIIFCAHYGILIRIVGDINNEI